MDQVISLETSKKILECNDKKETLEYLDYWYLVSLAF